MVNVSYICPNSRELLIWIHGGCFKGGSSFNDKPLMRKLKKHINVMCLDHKSPTPIETAQKIEKTYQKMKNEYEKVYIGGISSGCYFILWWLAHNRHVNKEKDVYNLLCYMVAPVLDPYIRHNNISKLKQKLQLQYFGSIEEMNKSVNDLNFYHGYPTGIYLDYKKMRIIVGGNDQDAIIPTWFDGRNESKYYRFDDMDHENMCKELHKFIDGGFNDLFEDCSLTM